MAMAIFGNYSHAFSFSEYISSFLIKKGTEYTPHVLQMGMQNMSFLFFNNFITIFVLRKYLLPFFIGYIIMLMRGI
jgi:hypothetical protein